MNRSVLFLIYNPYMLGPTQTKRSGTTTVLTARCNRNEHAARGTQLLYQNRVNCRRRRPDMNCVIWSSFWPTEPSISNDKFHFPRLEKLATIFGLSHVI